MSARILLAWFSSISINLCLSLIIWPILALILWGCMGAGVLGGKGAGIIIILSPTPLGGIPPTPPTGPPIWPPPIGPPIPPRGWGIIIPPGPGPTIGGIWGFPGIWGKIGGFLIYLLLASVCFLIFYSVSLAFFSANLIFLRVLVSTQMLKVGGVSFPL